MPSSQVTRRLAVLITLLVSVLSLSAAVLSVTDSGFIASIRDFAQLEAANAQPLPPVGYTVTYVANGSTGGSAPVDPASPYAGGATAGVLGPGDLIKSGYLFTGWNTAADGTGTRYTPAQGFIVNANTTLYAQWVVPPCQPGGLDRNFGTAGKLNTEINYWDIAYSVMIQTDGKILVAGSSSGGLGMVRYSSDGSLDSTFGTGGKATSTLLNANAAVMQPDGKIVLTGYLSNGSNNDVAIARFNSNGSPDTTFGTAGVTVTNISGYDDSGKSLALQPDGKIVVGVQASNGSNDDFAVVRYTATGALDATFGTSGMTVTDIQTNSADVQRSILVQPDGKIVSGGYTNNGSGVDFALVRYTGTGTLDNTFGTGGKVVNGILTNDDYLDSIALQPDGKIVAAGQAVVGWVISDYALARYNTNGSLDSSFGTGGKVTTALIGAVDEARAVVIQPDGKIVAAGETLDQIERRQFGIVRYNANGTLDSSFGTAGITITPILLSDDEPYAVAIQPDGKIVAAGSTWNGGNLDFAVARFGDICSPPAAVVTDTATAVLPTSATLNGSANPNGASSTGWFRYSSTDPGTCNDSFGTRLPVSGGADLGNGTAPVSFSQTASGLSMGSTYYYCAIAANNGGTSFGNVLSFQTEHPDYTVSTTGNTIVVTDVAGNADILTITPSGPGNVEFDASGRTFSVDGGATASNSSGPISLASVSSITVNAGAGDDTVLLTSFSSNLPSMTLNGGTGNDTVQVNGNVTFAANANLDLNLQNDDAIPGIDDVNFVGVATFSGTGSVLARASRTIYIGSSGGITTQNGNITLEANQQTIAATGNFHGVTVNGPVQATGSGVLTVNARGGSGDAKFGVYVTSGGSLRGGTTSGGTTTNITGTGGTGGTHPHGVMVEDTGVIGSYGGNVSVVGTAGPGSIGDNYGVYAASGGTITSGGNGSVSVTGTGGTNVAGSNIGVMVLQGLATITSSGTGFVVVNGTGGAGPNGHGVMLFRNGRILTGGSGTLTINGTAAGTIGNGVYGYGIDTRSTIASGGGLITLNGTGAGFSGVGISLDSTDVNPTSNANQLYIADTMILDGNLPFIGNTNHTITLRQKTNGRVINVGGSDSATTLGLLDSELDRISKGTIIIGDANSGDVDVTSDITRPDATNIHLNSGANIYFVAGMIQTDGNVSLTPGGTVYAHNDGVDIDAFTNNVTIATGKTLSLTLNGTTADTQYDQLSVHDGHLDITGVTLQLTGSYIPQPGDHFLLVNNDSPNAITGTFAGLPEGTIIPNFQGCGYPAQITYTGNDGNDVVITVATPASFSINNVTLAEGNSGTKNFTFTISRGGNPMATTSLYYATADGTAVAPGDYTAIPSTNLSFLAGETSKTISVVVNGDTVVEPDEVFYVNLSSPLGGTISSGTGTGTILNDDAAATMQFSSANFIGDESRAAQLTVTRTGDTSVASDVTFDTVAGGTATAGATCTGTADYVAVSGQTVHFAIGDTSQTVNVTLCADNAIDPGETIKVQLSNPTAPAGLGTPSLATLTVNDTAAQFRNSTAVLLAPGSASLYPSPIAVTGAPSSIGIIRVTLFDVSALNPQSLDVLLVGPQGQKFVLMSDCGGTSSSGPATLTFQDWAPTFMDHTSALTTGMFKPTSWLTPVGDFPAPAPVGPYAEPGWTAGHPTLSSTYAATNPNGTWNLYARYRVATPAPLVDALTGSINAGWGIQFFAPTAATVSVAGRVQSFDGVGIRNARVTLDDGTGHRLSAITNGFGYYQFDAVEPGRTYLLNAGAKGYIFTPQVVAIRDRMTDLTVTALP